VSQASTTPPFSGYALRRVVVASDLHALRGPLQGHRQLPLHLDSSARPFYDFASPRDRAHAYQLVLLEAIEDADLERWLQPAAPAEASPADRPGQQPPNGRSRPRQR